RRCAAARAASSRPRRSSPTGRRRRPGSCRRRRPRPPRPPACSRASRPRECAGPRPPPRPLRPAAAAKPRPRPAGGASEGGGAGTARELAARGARVSLVGLEPDRLEALAGELGGDAAWFEADVRDVDALERAVAGTVDRFGGIDVVVANAGIRNPMATVATVDPPAFERVIEVNLLGTWRTVRAVLPQLVESRGYLLCVASLAAAAHGPLFAPYAAAKAGVEAFANCLRLEVEEQGVDVGVAYFSFIETDMVREGREVAEAQAGRPPPRPMTRTLPVAKAARGVVRGI